MTFFSYKVQRSGLPWPREACMGDEDLPDDEQILGENRKFLIFKFENLH